MKGKRVELIPQEGGFQSLSPGEYGKWADGEWYAETPNGHGANISGHVITEHEDGTITVTPSIAVSTSLNGKKVEVFHGWLIRGEWCDEHKRPLPSIKERA
jgi:hypothetical protein